MSRYEIREQKIVWNDRQRSFLGEAELAIDKVYEVWDTKKNKAVTFGRFKSREDAEKRLSRMRHDTPDD